MQRFFAQIGHSTLQICRDTGGIVILSGQVLRALVPPSPNSSIDGRELIRNLHKMANTSVPIVVLTAFFTGALIAIQSAVLVKRLEATGLVGWAGGYAILREIGPILIALMFSGRVGANNTAELATMTATEQIDALRALAIEPIRYLVVPRVAAMIIALFALTVVGDLIALAGGALFATLVMDVEFATLYHSLVDNLRPMDFLHGIIKAAAFGLVIALTSCYFGALRRATTVASALAELVWPNILVPTVVA